MGILNALFKKRIANTHHEKRGKPRYTCAIPTELMDAAGRIWGCRIVDISETGFSIVSPASLNKGSIMNILKPSIVAEVVWAHDNKAGLRAVR